MSHLKYDHRLTQINLGHWAELIQMRSLFQNDWKYITKVYASGLTGPLQLYKYLNETL